MHRFQIRPSDQSLPSAELISPDAAVILDMVRQLECREADVMQDGDYAFSVRLEDTGLWCIFQRDEAPGPTAPMECR